MRCETPRAPTVEQANQAGRWGWWPLWWWAASSLTCQAILRRYTSMAHTYAMTRTPTHQASAIQISFPTGCCSYNALIVLTIAVTGWFSAKARTGPGIVAVGTNAELTNGRKMMG